MDQGHRVHVGGQIVVQLKGIGAHLQDDGILGREGLAQPGVQARELDPLGAQYLVELRIDPAGHQVMLVTVQADEARRGGWCSGHG
ncbi:MAG: hypothetical protein KKA73_16575 [Chloroflexi bacterium]|nr:hypothetical protein [Chloroflexota bacterium]